jgi:hypothetical protein
MSIDRAVIQLRFDFPRLDTADLTALVCQWEDIVACQPSAVNSPRVFDKLKAVGIELSLQLCEGVRIMTTETEHTTTAEQIDDLFPLSSSSPAFASDKPNCDRASMLARLNLAANFRSVLHVLALPESKMRTVLSTVKVSVEGHASDRQAKDDVLSLREQDQENLSVTHGVAGDEKANFNLQFNR